MLQPLPIFTLPPRPRPRRRAAAVRRGRHMDPKKQKAKDRRRARKLAGQAWEAVDAGNLDLAEKIVRRAVAARVDNPVLWVDQGMILGLRGKEAEAADAFRAAISLAPTFAEPYAHLAA